jgi:hypothetical protein
MARRIQQAQQLHQLYLLNQAVQIHSIPSYHLLPTCISAVPDGTFEFLYETSDSPVESATYQSSDFVPIRQSPFIISIFKKKRKEVPPL